MSGKDKAKEIQLTGGSIHDDIKAFEHLYGKLRPVLEQILESYDNHGMSPDDFIQEVFTRLWQSRMSFRGESRYFTYLYGIAKNTVNEEIRRSRKIRTKELKGRKAINKNTCRGLSEPENVLFTKELMIVLEKARMAKLTSKERQAMELSQVNDASLTEISQIAGCSREAFKSRLKRARKRSNKLIDPDLIIE